MDLGLRGKIAVVTGASRGIGKAIALSLINEGCAVAICGRNAERLTAAVNDLSKDGARVVGVPTDVTSESAVGKFVGAAVEAFGRIDILVNNAGTHIRGTVETTTPAILEAQLRDKVFGFFAMIQAVLPVMKRQRDGRIVNIVGQAARHPHPDRFPSGVTNAAVMAMTKSVADAVARDNIRVNAVCPQYIESELLASLIEKEMRERGVDRARAAAGFTRANPLGRTGTPQEVADLVAYLASDCAGFVAGTSVSIDGGYHRYVFG
jgi:NAD(P)-dependent dehydrogenase (short-subunit alcohol dehydrogenase family)